MTIKFSWQMGFLVLILETYGTNTNIHQVFWHSKDLSLIIQARIISHYRVYIYNNSMKQDTQLYDPYKLILLAVVVSIILFLIITQTVYFPSYDGFDRRRDLWETELKYIGHPLDKKEVHEFE